MLVISVQELFGNPFYCLRFTCLISNENRRLPSNVKGAFYYIPVCKSEISVQLLFVINEYYSLTDQH